LPQFQIEIQPQDFSGLAHGHSFRAAQAVINHSDGVRR
jgi:hypothetical protein